MKIKVAEVDRYEVGRERRQDMQKMRRNADPVVHPFETAREYTRALNAVKLARLFSKPFIGQLGDGHVDGVYTMQKHGHDLCRLVTGGADGYIKVWHTGENGIKGNNEKCQLWSAKGHESIVRGVAFLQQEHQVDKVISCGDDGAIRLWQMADHSESDSSGSKMNTTNSSFLGAQLCKPVREWGRDGYQRGGEPIPFTNLDSHPKSAYFATTGASISIWHAGHASQSAPVQTFQWGEDTFYSVRYHPIETHLLAATASDRSILLLDTRLATPIHRVVMALRSNAVRWHPREPFNFASASDDHHAYLWDMRKLQQSSSSPSSSKFNSKRNASGALAIYKDHVGPVMDLDYSPTGCTLVTASYDKTIRLFDLAPMAATGHHARDVYHTKRMQRIFAIQTSLDNSMLFSASDDGQIRAWRLYANHRPGISSAAQTATRQYHDSLIQRFSHLPEVQQISRNRHLPKPIVVEKKKLRIMEMARKKKEENRRAHTKPGTVPYSSDRTTHIVAVKK